MLDDFNYNIQSIWVGWQKYASVENNPYLKFLQDKEIQLSKVVCEDQSLQPTIQTAYEKLVDYIAIIHSRWR